MAKYINAELLKKGLKELESVIHSNELVGQSMHPYDGGQLHAIKIVKELIDSLQQEQPDAEALKREWWNKGYYEGRKNAHIPAKELGLPKAWDFQQEQTCDTCTNDKGCVTCKDGELWEGKEQPCEDLEEGCKNKDWGILQDMSIGEEED